MPQCKVDFPTLHVAFWGAAPDGEPYMGTFQHKYLEQLQLFVCGEESPFEKSMRRLRNKLRFNYAAKTAVWRSFLMLSLDQSNFEQMLAQKQKIQVSLWMREWINRVKNTLDIEFEYAWRLELSGRYTNRCHVHLLVTFECASLSEMHHRLWELWGRCQWEVRPYRKKLRCRTFDCEPVENEKKAFSYISKYFSKDRKDGHQDQEPDPIIYGKRRFATSRGVKNAPSRWLVVDADWGKYQIRNGIKQEDRKAECDYPPCDTMEACEAVLEHLIDLCPDNDRKIIEKIDEVRSQFGLIRLELKPTAYKFGVTTITVIPTNLALRVNRLVFAVLALLPERYSFMAPQYWGLDSFAAFLNEQAKNKREKRVSKRAHKCQQTLTFTYSVDQFWPDQVQDVWILYSEWHAVIQLTLSDEMMDFEQVEKTWFL